jgi:O-acetyl-ADP-ribose deacetylase (regulator of RNase III)
MSSKFKFPLILSIIAFGFTLQSEASLLECLGKMNDRATGRERTTPMNIELRASAIGTEITAEVRAMGMMPRGSAVATSSGILAQKGITQIIHAASGSMGLDGRNFGPSLDGVVKSVMNSLELARRNGHKRVALPFIGGKIFVERIGIPAQELAKAIVDNAMIHRGDLELRIVTFGSEDTSLFTTAMAPYRTLVPSKTVDVVDGSITDFNLHGATAIVNAANMEVIFGGGLSGVIARASGQADAINAEAQKTIKEFYQGHE